MNHQPINFLPENTPPPSPPKRRLVFFITVLSLFFLAILWIGYIFASPLTSSDPLAYDPITLEPKKPQGVFNKIRHFVFPKDYQLKGEKEDRINILLLGQGGPGHDGPYLTDTILLVSIEPETKKVAFVSIPRDLAVPIPGDGMRKINHANSFGEEKGENMGPAYVSKVLTDLFGVDIHYYVRVDFKAFEEIIDDVGGVTVQVDRSFVDTEYPTEDDRYQTISFKQGRQTLDGKTALTFVRSRHGNNGEGSDFARSKRQQKVILALKEKILSAQTLLNPVKLNGIVTSLNRNVLTNMDFADIMAFAKLSKELQTENLNVLTLDNSANGYLMNGKGRDGDILLPRSGDFKEIKKAIQDIFLLSPTQTPAIPQENTSTTTIAPVEVEEKTIPNVEVQNGTWQVGLAAQIKKQLEDKKIHVETVGNTNTRPQPTSGIYAITVLKDKSILSELQKELNIPVKEKPPRGEYATTTSDILIIIGEDFKKDV